MNENHYTNAKYNYHENLKILRKLVNELMDFQSARIATEHRIRSLNQKYSDMIPQHKDCMYKEILEGEEGFTEEEKKLKQEIEDYAKDTRLWNEWCIDVKGLGLYSCGLIVGLLEPYWARMIVKQTVKNNSKPIEKTLYPFASRSALLKICGHALNKNGMSVGKYRNVKGLRGNPKIKAYFWRIGKNLVMAKGIYYELFKIINEKTKKDYSKYLMRHYGVETREEAKKKYPHVKYIASTLDITRKKFTKLFISHIWEEFQRIYKLPITSPQHNPSIEYNNQKGISISDEQWIHPLRDNDEQSRNNLEQYRRFLNENQVMPEK